jgi:hypothetical protein
MKQSEKKPIPALYRLVTESSYLAWLRQRMIRETLFQREMHQIVGKQ